ncbi:MAG TPA: hypothetical protein VF131_01770 [Blastocatellia bacterium]|nr:hypothetical protein [Blastocatellia bacterium]
MHVNLLIITNHMLQLGRGCVALLANLAPEQMELPSRKAWRLATAVRQRGQVADLAPLTKQLVDKGRAYAELLSDFGNSVLYLLVSADDSLT